MELPDYVHQRERTLREKLGLPTDEMVFEVAADGQSARIDGDITITDDLYISITERIEMRGGGAEIVKYSYYVVADESEVEGFDKDAKHDPAIHGHIGADHERVPAREVTLEWFVERSYEWVELRATTETSPQADQTG